MRDEGGPLWFLLSLLILLLAPFREHVWQPQHPHVRPGMKISSSWKMSWYMHLAAGNIPASGPALEQPVGLFSRQAAGGPLLYFVLTYPLCYERIFPVVVAH